MTHIGDPRDDFDAALIPGMRKRLAAAYARFRAKEADAVRAMMPPETGGSLASYRLRDCPCCGTGSAGQAPVLQAHGLDLLECPTCHLTYTREVMDAAADAARYAASDLDQEAMRLRTGGPYLELETARDRYYLDRLEADGLVPGRLLEIGSGTGTFLLEAARRGWQALGVEPGRMAAELARQRGAEVVLGWFPDDLPPGHDANTAVAVLDVLEHFADPLTFLAQLRAHLAPHGRLLVQVPNWDSLLVRLEGAASSLVAPGHWSYFTPTTLAALLARAGFHPVSLETVVSELDRISAYPATRIAAALARLRPEAPPWPLSAAALHEQKLGYKLVGVFEPANPSQTRPPDPQFCGAAVNPESCLELPRTDLC